MRVRDCGDFSRERPERSSAHVYLVLEVAISRSASESLLVPTDAVSCSPMHEALDLPDHSKSPLIKNTTRHVGSYTIWPR